MKHFRLIFGVVVVIGLAWLVLATWQAPPADLAAERHAPRGRSVEQVQRGQQVAAWVATALGRPLFSATRRPAVDTQTVAVADAPPPLPRLTAVLVGPFGKVAVFVLNNGAGKAVTVHENDRAGPYRIRRITPGAVVVDGPEGELTLHPVFNKSQPGPDGQQASSSQRAAVTPLGRSLAAV